jgi:hypothetical protein
MDVANKLTEVGILLTKNGFVAVLKQMPASAVAMVEIYGISGQQAPHDGRNGGQAGFEQQMNMVRHQGPGKAWRVRFIKDISKSLDKLISVAVIAKDLTLLDTPKDDVVNRSRRIYACFAWHVFLIGPSKDLVKLFIYL